MAGEKNIHQAKDGKLPNTTTDFCHLQRKYQTFHRTNDLTMQALTVNIY